MKISRFAALLLASVAVPVKASLLDGTSSSAIAFDEFNTRYGEDYDHRHCLSDEFCILWKISGGDLELAMIQGGAAASGWLGFGIGEAGGMPGADIVVYEAETNTLRDYYALGYATPLEDACASDWTLVGATVQEDDGFTAVRARRALDTGDSQDHALVDDSDITTPATAIIAAWGDGAAMSYHGKKAARSMVRFLQATVEEEEEAEEETTTSVATNRATTLDILTADGDEPEIMINPSLLLLQQASDGNIMVHEEDVLIPLDETTYTQTCFNVTDFFTEEQLAKGVYLTGIMYTPSVQVSGVDTTPWVHHMVSNAGHAPCAPPGQRTDQSLVYAWAPGGQPLVFPSNVGLKVGGEDGIQSFGLGIHYDNRDAVPDLIDSSGVTWYYVNEPREHEMGIFLVGDATVNLAGQAVGEGVSAHSFTCPGSCSQTMLNGPITVFLEALHEHEQGARVVNEVIRNGEVVNKGSAEVFDFRSNGLIPVQQQSFEVLPGDSFRTTCYYDVTANDTVFGIGTRQEMCQSLMYYYPVGKSTGSYCAPDFRMPACNATYTTSEPNKTFGRTFGTARDVCPATLEAEGETTSSTSAGRVGCGIVFAAGVAVVASMLQAM